MHRLIGLALVAFLIFSWIYLYRNLSDLSKPASDPDSLLHPAAGIIKDNILFWMDKK